MKQRTTTFPKGCSGKFQGYSIRHMPVEFLDHLRIEAARRRTFTETVILSALDIGIRVLRKERVEWE